VWGAAIKKQFVRTSQCAVPSREISSQQLLLLLLLIMMTMMMTVMLEVMKDGDDLTKTWLRYLRSAETRTQSTLAPPGESTACQPPSENSIVLPQDL